MDLIPWTEEYLTGLDEIDNDHRMLFALVNDLNTRITSGDRGAIGITLKSLADYVDYHFTREELAMESAGYPDLVAHIKRHRDLAATVRSLGVMHEEDPAALDGDDVLNFLGDWLTGHIMNSDMDYVPFVKRHQAG